MDDNHPSKSDQKDPKTIAKLVCDGRYNEPYIPEGVYADLWTLMECRRRVCKELNQIKNRLQRWLSIYFPEFVKVYCKIDTVSGVLVLENAPLPEDILALGAAVLNELWRKSKVKAVGMKKTMNLYEAAKNSVGCQGGNGAQLELQLLLADYRIKMEQYAQIMAEVEKLVKQVPNADKLMEINGVGLVTVAGFVAEIGDIGRFQSPKQIQKLAGLALRENSSGHCKGRTTISRRGRARLLAILFQAVMPLVSQNQQFKEIHQYYTTRSTTREESITDTHFVDRQNEGIEGQGFYASIGLRMEPLPIGSGIQFESKVSLGYLNPPFQTAVRDGVLTACKHSLWGWELTDARITFTYGKYFSPISTPSDFRRLAPHVLEQALRQSGTSLLEPVCSYTLEIPEPCIGRAIQDIQLMRGTVDGMSAQNNGWHILSGIVPMETARNYALDVVSYTEGAGVFFIQHIGYEQYGGKPVHSNWKNNDGEQLRHQFIKAERRN